MMRTVLIFWLVFLPLLNASAVDIPLSEAWSQHFVKGVNKIQALDLDNTGSPKIYAISYGPTDATIYVLNLDGSQEDTFVVEPKLKYQNEGIRIAYLLDVDGNGLLDILAGSEAHAGPLNAHVLYEMERRWDNDLRRYYTYMKWKYEESDLTTSIHYADLYGDGKSEVVASSRDGSVRVFNAAGNVTKQLSVGDSIWDMQPFAVGNETGMALALAMYRKLEVLKDGNESWEYDVPTRFDKVYASDVDQKGDTEILGVSDGMLYLFDGKGVERWEYKFDGIEDVNVMNVALGNYSTIVVASKNSLFFLDGDGVLTSSYDAGDKILSLYSFNYGEDSSLVVGTDSSLKYFTVDVNYFKRKDAQALEQAASSYFSSGEFNKTIGTAVKAKEHYNEIVDIDALSRLDSIINNASNIMDAENVYRKARAYFDAGDYENTTLYANRSFVLFQNANYPVEVEKSRLLISSVEDKRKADELYGQAEAKYIASDFSGALDYAGRAKELYVRISYTEGIAKSSAIIDFATSKLNLTETIQTTVTTHTTVAPARRSDGSENTIFYAAIGLIAVIIVFTIYRFVRRE